MPPPQDQAHGYSRRGAAISVFRRLITTFVASRPVGAGDGRVIRRMRLSSARTGRDLFKGLTPDAIATLAVCAMLAAMVTLQAPGRVASDTKLDLYTDPVDMMHRAARLWDGRTAFGYLPNQQWGYLFPIGPFFSVGRILGVETWLVQRAWLSGLLIVALLGMRRLAQELSIGTPTTRLVAATTYALSPAMLVHLGQTSAGIPLAMAALPWVTIPLIVVQRKGAPATAACISALAFAAGGSVNATIALMMLPFPALWLLLRARGPRRRSVIRWWIAAIAAASIGPLVGLLQLKRYGFNFTKLTESADDTAATLNTTDVLRGSSDWLAYFNLGKPWSPAGQQFVHSVPVILTIGLITALGITGLARSDLPERRWLSLTFGLGVVGQAIAYRGLWAGPFADRMQRLLDGPLVALRNLSKLAPLVALPLALGLAHFLGSVARPLLRKLIPYGAAAAVVVATFPIANGNVFASGSFSSIPGYWREAARFLAQDAMARTLVTPSASFGEYTWGRTIDEPLQSIGRAPSVTRDIYPSGGSLQAIRLLDQIDSRLSRGEPVPGLSEALVRTGIRYVMVRSDLDRDLTGTAEPAVFAAALDATPGLSRARHFGPLISSITGSDRLVPRLVAPLHTLEIYEVSGRPTIVTTQPADPVQLLGGLESILNPELSAFVGSRPILVDADGEELLTPSSVVVADGLRLHDRTFGDARGALNTSYTLGANELPPGNNRLVPVNLSEPSESLSIAGEDGAHTSASTSFSALARFPEAQPYAAFDENPWTSWMPDPKTTNGTGEWIQASFSRQRSLGGATIRLLFDAPWRPTISAVRVVTDHGSRNTTLKRTSEPQEITLPPGASAFLRIEILSVEGYSGGSSQVGVAEVTIPDLIVRRPLIVPNAPSESTPSFFFERTTTPNLDPTRWSEEPLLDRLFSAPTVGDYTLVATASLRQPTSTAIMESYTGGGPIQASATSSWFGRTTVSAAGAIDSDPTTAWVADPYDPRPTLTINWANPQTLTGIHIVAAGAPYREPTEVIVRAPNRKPQRVQLINGAAKLSQIRASAVEVEIVDSKVVPGTTYIVTPPAAAIQQISFNGADDSLDQTTIPRLGCGLGPSIRIDGKDLLTRPIGTIEEILSGGRVTLSVCGQSQVSLGNGLHRVSEVNGGAFALSSVSLHRIAPEPSSSPKRDVTVQRWDDDARVLKVDAGPQTILSIAENFNSGWTATFLGRDLAAVRLDGWHQGWIVPAGLAGEIHLAFRPTASFQTALIFCVIVFICLGLVAFLVRHRSASRRPPTTERRVAPWLSDLAALIALVMIGGFAALAVPIVRRLRRDPVVLATVAGIAVLLSTIVSAIGRDTGPGSATGAFSGVAQLSSLVAVACVLVALPADANAAVEASGPLDPDLHPERNDSK